MYQKSRPALPRKLKDTAKNGKKLQKNDSFSLVCELLLLDIDLREKK